MIFVKDKKGLRKIMSKNEIGSISREGFELRYVIEGQSLPTIVIGSSLYYPKSFSENLREHLRMAFIDWRGFAKSAPTQCHSEVSFNTFLEDIESIRHKIGFERCIIIGHSAHALLALEYAKKFPDNVSHVVMIGISPNLSSDMIALAQRNWEESVWPERKEALESRIMQLPDEELAKLSASERFVSWCVRRGPQTWYDFHYNSSSLWEGVHPNMSMLDFLYGIALRDLDITQSLEGFNKPVFLALGRFDFVIAPPSSWDSIRSKFKDLTVRIFEHSGHSPQYEEASLFDQELLNWLSTRLGGLNNGYTEMLFEDPSGEHPSPQRVLHGKKL